MLASIASPSVRPSPLRWRVGIRIFTFEACSDFTHITARWIAQPPKATFVTRLQISQLPNRPARQLPDYRQLSGWIPPPLVTRALRGTQRNPGQLSSPSSSALQKSGSFPPPELPGFIGTTSLSGTPAGAAALKRRRGRYPRRSGSPPLPASPVPSVPFPLPRRTGRVPASIASPSVRPSPLSLAGRHPHLHFRGLLRLHSRYGPLGSLSRPRRPLSRGFGPAESPNRSCSSATRPIDNYLGGSFLHW